MDYYTLRVSNSDTIRFSDGESPFSGWLPVLSDYYFDILKRIPAEEFKFIGLINDTIVISEPFVYTSGKCHIVKI